MLDNSIALVRRSGFYAAHMLRQFTAYRCLTSAASLSFTSLLALVPLAAIGLAILAAFPVFAGVAEMLTGFILENFSPDAGNSIQEYFATFVNNASRLTGAGILFLIGTSAMLLYEIESIFQQIWQAPKRRPLAARLMVFWTAMTLGPLLLGLALSLSASFYASMLKGGVAEEPISVLGAFMPVVLEITGFSFLYFALPNVPVRFRHALIGGIVAGLLFEALKYGFGVYIRNFAAYDAIYGALSALPVFLIWTYLSWVVILFGGIIAAEFPKLRNAQ